MTLHVNPETFELEMDIDDVQLPVAACQWFACGGSSRRISYLSGGSADLGSQQMSTVRKGGLTRLRVLKPWTYIQKIDIKGNRCPRCKEGPVGSIPTYAPTLFPIIRLFNLSRSLYES